MAVEIWAAFVLATIVLLIIPGPTILTVISYSLSHGNKAKVPLILAVALGDSTALALSLLGLGTLLAESAFWFQAIKWAGGLYLLYLGAKLLMSAASAPSELPDSPDERSSYALFLNTYLVTALNPKGIIFFRLFTSVHQYKSGRCATALVVGDYVCLIGRIKRQLVCAVCG